MIAAALRARRLLSVTVLLVAVAAVSSSALAQPVAAPVKHYALPAFGVAFAVPADWSAKDYRDPGLHRQFGGAYGPSVKFAAHDPELVGGFRTNVVLAVVPAAAGMTLRGLARRELIPYRRDPAVTIVGSQADFVQLPGGRAWRISVRIADAGNDRGSASQLGYYFLRNGRVYVFSYVTLHALDGKYAATFRAWARSIRFAR